MSNIKVTQKQIDELMNSAEVKVDTAFGKCTVVTAKLKNGFILTESSACVDPANYDETLGAELCYQHIENRLWELEGYALQRQIHEEQNSVYALMGTFGWAIECMKRGKKLRRRGWNGKGIFIALQVPDGYSKMSSPYIYIDTTGLLSENADAPRSCVPWLASQTDMLAGDWEIAE